VFLVNSRLSRFSATPFGLGARSSSPTRGPPFFRSYGGILPSSFSKIHSSTLGFSPHLRVSVYGTDVRRTPIEAFLGSLIRTTLRAEPSSSPLGIMTLRICLEDLPTGLNLDNQRQAGLSLLRPPLGTLSFARRFRNVRLIAIAYASRPRLRTRLTLSGLTFLRKP
jgi:hypothetical protein